MRSLTSGIVPSPGGGGVGGGAPDDAQYIVAASNATLTAERVATDTATVTWDFGTAAQAKANVPDGAITYAKIQDVSATDKVLGRSSVGAGDVEEIACTAAGRALLDDASAAAQRTTLGVGTADSPEFAAINIGAATDTTITRTGAGDIAVEGNAIYRAGGTDVPIADGGTGQSTATAAFDALAPTTTQGDIIYHNGTDNVRLAAGTSGMFLQTLGASANPVWAASRFFTVHNAGQGAGHNPADSTTYYFGRHAIFNPDGTYGTWQLSPTFACTIREVRITIIVGGTAGTAGQNVTFSIRVNNTTDNALGAHDFSASYTEKFSGLSIALAIDDTFAVKMATPAWTTNPTAVFYSAEISYSVP